MILVPNVLQQILESLPFVVIIVIPGQGWHMSCGLLGPFWVNVQILQLNKLIIGDSYLLLLLLKKIRHLLRLEGDFLTIIVCTDLFLIV